MHIQLKGHLVADPLIPKHVYAFQDQHIRGQEQLIGIRPHLVGIVVGIAGDGLPPFQGIQVLQQLVKVEYIRFVIIDPASLLKRQVAIVLIIAILPQDQGVAGEGIPDLPGHGTFTAAAGAADANGDQRLIPPLL